ncbi:MAG: hypothetical protein ABSC94_05945 [Polyangiaceae bacterium]|jgi:uncharacterized protein YejL (UPF0352 family)
MADSLRSQINALATSFANDILGAIRRASLDDLRVETSIPARSHSAAVVEVKSAPRVARPSASGRLPRRSSEDILELLNQIVAVVKKSKTGLRAEQIRSELSLQSKELPRVLKEGLALKKLKSKGQKRATTYFAT